MPLATIAERRPEKRTLLALLRQIRTEAGLRQVDVAKALGVPQSYVSNYESGERRMDVLELRRVCGMCGSSLKEFTDRLERGLRESRGD